MCDPQRELEHLGKLAAAEPTKRFGKLYRGVSLHRGCPSLENTCARIRADGQLEAMAKRAAISIPIG
jgi:hypothetical protein